MGSPESEFVIRKAWTDAQGVRRASMVFANFQERYQGGLSLSGAKAFLESGPTAIRAGGSHQRFWKQDGSSITLLAGSGKEFHYGRKIPVESWDGLLAQAYDALMTRPPTTFSRWSAS